MLRFVQRVLSAALSLVLGFAPPMLPGVGASAFAASRLPQDQPSNTHNSVLRVSEADGFPQTRTIRIGRNKSMLIEMPRDLRDVMVSAPEIVDAVVQTSNRVHLIGKKIGQSNAFFFDASGEQILTLEISVEQDTQVLDQLFARLIPGSNIKSEILSDSVILTGSVRSPIDSSRAADIASRFTVGGAADDKPKIVNLLSVEGEEQVMLRVVVAEVQRTLLKQFGINLGAAINSGNFSTSILTENALPLTKAQGLGTLPVPAVGTAALAAGAAVGCTTAGVLCNWNNGPAGGTFGNSGVTSAFSDGTTQVSQTLRALERDGLLRTLAEPNLTAVSGEAAKFLAGGEFPILKPDSFGQTTVEFKQYGIGVSFTPVVLSEGRISLKIESEVSELTNTGAVQLNGITVPALKTRKANSTVELPSGGSLALAGLISDSTRQNIDGLPGLKELPILGTLFRSRDFIKEETELVVIVTPYLVKPVAKQELARPLDGLVESSDRKANFMGHLNRIYGTERVAPAGDLKGDYGFIVE